MIAEIVILSERAETLVKKVYRKEALKYNAVAIFCKKLWDIRAGKIPPHFEKDGVYFYFIHRGSLFFLATSNREVTPVAVTEFLSRVYSMTKDVCGVVTEESVRINFLPVFEILCDAVDCGYPQVASTEGMKTFLQSEPVSVRLSLSPQEEIASRIFGIDIRMAPASATQKPVMGSSVEDKGVYVDIVENLSIVTNSLGDVNHLKVDGTMCIQSYLPGRPLLKVALNEDLQLCQPGQQKVYGKSAQLERCKFHPDVDLSEFEDKRVLKITPSLGEFSAMTYSVGESSLIFPLMVCISVQDIKNSRDVSVTIHVKPNFPHTAEAALIHVLLPVPEAVSSISQHASGPSESLTFKAQGSNRDDRKAVKWTIHNMANAQESTAYIRLISHNSKTVPKTDIGPATVDFEINQLTLSGLRLRNLKIYTGNKLCPAKRFVRYLVTSDSYTVKVP